MGKVFALLSMALLAVASVVGCWYLVGKITDGEMRIAEGQEQLEEGLCTLDHGRVMLENGKQKLLAGKKEFAQTENNLLLVLADRLLAGSLYSRDAKRRISAGEKQVAKGEDKTSIAKGSLNEGERRLCQGRRDVNLAKYALLACSFGAAGLVATTIVLGFFWRPQKGQT